MTRLSARFRAGCRCSDGSSRIVFWRPTVTARCDAAMLRHATLKRFGRPQEVAELLAFYAGDKASYLTGIDIPCDGGVTGSVTLRDRLSIARKPL